MTANHGRRPYRWAMLLMLGIALAMPLLPYALAGKDSPIVVPNPGAELWRDARQALEGTTQVRGVDAGVLINDAGERWRAYRVQQLAPYSAYVLGGMLGLFALYFLVRGRIRIEGGRSGRVVQRSTVLERWVHWFVAAVFVVLGLTGLILLYGKWILIPILGPEGFSATAQVCKLAHNYLGPLFLVAIPLMFVVFLRDSLFNLKVDLKWMLKAGGYFGGRHPSSGKLNAGQKAWYWVAVLTGVVLCASGLILDFPNFGQGRELMQGAHLFHTIASVIVLAFFIVHLYLATIGTEGAFEGMVDGNVDANWAKQHHDLWFKEAEKAGEVLPAPDARGGDANQTT